MTSESKRSSPVRPVLYGLLSEVLAFVTSVLVITVYATYLGFKARGAPDQALISQFAGSSAPWITAVVGIMLVFAFAKRVARKSGAHAAASGLTVGISAAVFDCVVVLAMRSHLGLHTAVVVGLLIGAGWLGGHFGGQGAQA